MDPIIARSIFTPASGYIRRAGFRWTCNPYVGCTFGCTYCYAMFLPQNRRPRDQWGRWLEAKTDAVALARRQAPRLAGRAVYLSSVTDPYLPVERSLGLTRGILEAILPYQPRLLVQTRGPLVVRDADLLAQFRRVRINVSIPTDAETIRRAFEPKAPPLEDRWQALATLRAAGLSTGICVTPALPLRDPAAFASRIAAFAADVVVTQEFQHQSSAFGAGTGEQARRLATTFRWTTADHRAWLDGLRLQIPVHEGEAGFFPP